MLNARAIVYFGGIGDETQKDLKGGDAIGGPSTIAKLATDRLSQSRTGAAGPRGFEGR